MAQVNLLKAHKIAGANFASAISQNTAVDIAAVFWLLIDETWRLSIVTPDVDKETAFKARRSVIDTVRSLSEEDAEMIGSVFLFGPRDPVARDLFEASRGKPKNSIDGVRFTEFGGRFVLYETSLQAA